MCACAQARSVAIDLPGLLGVAEKGRRLGRKKLPCLNGGDGGQRQTAALVDAFSQLWGKNNAGGLLPGRRALAHQLPPLHCSCGFEVQVQLNSVTGKILLAAVD